MRLLQLLTIEVQLGDNHKKSSRELWLWFPDNTKFLLIHNFSLTTNIYCDILLSQLKQQEQVMGITNDGDSTEKELVSLVSNAKMMPKNSPLGDVEVLVNGLPYHIEVKKATLNQVRAYKYVTLVAKDPTVDYWVVIPAHEALKMARGRKGQHAINSFECLGLGKASRKAFESFRCNAEDLESRIEQAIIESNSPQNQVFKNFAASVRKSVQRLSEVHQTEMKMLLAG
jgi:hypothetical protein